MFNQLRNVMRTWRREKQRPDANDEKLAPSEPDMIARGWDQYARVWEPGKFRVIAGHHVNQLGDEWTTEEVTQGGTTYGLAVADVERFPEYVSEKLLAPYLPPIAEQGLEIGPGGGRLSVLLAPRTKVLHLAEPSTVMLEHLRKRCSELLNLRYYHTDGVNLPALPVGSLDYVIAFDVFVHFEPRLIFWYLRQIATLLKPGGVGIIHYPNALTPIGWKQFEDDLEANLHYRKHFYAFGVMCPVLMQRFLEALHLEVISVDTGAIPRDAVAVFRVPVPRL